MAWWAALAGQGMQQAGKLDDHMWGTIFAKSQDKRQLRQQKKLQALAIEGQKEMNDYNSQLALQMWKDTNFGAQMQQMKEAGISPGYIYGQSGSGGTTMGAGSGSPISQGQAPTGDAYGMAMQTGSMRAMAAAQQGLIEAQAKKTNIEADKLAGVDTKQTEAEIAKTIQDTANAKLQNEYQNYQNTIASVEAEIKQKTMEEAIDTIAYANQKLAGEAQSAMSDGIIKNATAQNVIEQSRLNTIEQQVRIGAIKQGIKVDQAQIKKISAEIAKMSEDVRAKWREWEQEEKERWLKERMVEAGEAETAFGTGAMAQTKQLVDIVTSILKATPTPSGGGGKIGFKQ